MPAEASSAAWVTGSCYVRIAPHEERIFSFTRLWRETLSGQPWVAFTENTSQRDVMQQVRAGLSKFHRFARLRCATCRRSISAAATGISILFCAGRILKRWRHYAEELRIRSKELGIIDADTTLKLDNPELRVVIDRKRAADLNVDTEHIASALV